MKRVLLDCDEILSDFCSAYLDLVQQVTGLYYSHSDVTDWDFGKALNLTPGQSRAVANLVTAGFADKLSVLPGAFDAVAKLCGMADVYIVTSPWNGCATWTYEREVWLWRHFRVPHKRVIHTSEKHLIEGDIFIDDRFETCVQWRDAHPGKTTVLWQQPWNERCAWSGTATNDWAQLIALVEQTP